MSLSAGEESSWLCLKSLRRSRWWFCRDTSVCDGLWNKKGRESVLCHRHPLISLTQIILILSLGFIPIEQPILNNSLFCRSLSLDDLEPGIRNACTESDLISHHSQTTLLQITSYQGLIYRSHWRSEVSNFIACSQIIVLETHLCAVPFFTYSLYLPNMRKKQNIQRIISAVCSADRSLLGLKINVCKWLFKHQHQQGY